MAGENVIAALDPNSRLILGLPGIFRILPSPSRFRCVLDTPHGLQGLACGVSEALRLRIPAPRALWHGSRTHPSPPTLPSAARAPL